VVVPGDPAEGVVLRLVVAPNEIELDAAETVKVL
jgi:hypothetical protein